MTAVGNHSNDPTTGSVPPVECHVEIPGWRLHLAQLERSRGRDLGNVMDMATRGAVAHLSRSFPDGRITSNHRMALIREEVRKIGVDPDRTPLAQERILSMLLDDPGTIRGGLAWEFLAVLTVKSLAPWSVLDRKELEPPLELRRGRAGERILEPGGDFDCSGLPVLADTGGPKASPWTVPVPEHLAGVAEPLFVCYLPRALYRKVDPRSHLGRTVWLTWAYRFVFERTCPPS